MNSWSSKGVCLRFGWHTLRHYGSNTIGDIRIAFHGTYLLNNTGHLSSAYRGRFLVPGGCGLDQHVVSHNCVACPPGTSSDTYDDPMGADTSCDVI